MKTLIVSKQIFCRIFFLIIFSFSALLHAQAANYSYADLQMKNFEEMQNRINARLKKAEAASNTDVAAAKALLKDALQLMFSRPNPDNMVSQLIPPVRTLLKNIEAYEATLGEIVGATIQEVTNKKLKPVVRATGFIVLNNFMSETKPEIANNEAIKKIFIKIRDAKLKVPEDVKAEMHLRSGLHAPASPSDIAEKILAEKPTEK